MSKKPKQPVIIETENPVKVANQKQEFTPYQIEELLKCASDPFYFIENYVYIVSESGNKKFLLYDFQKEIINNFINHRANITLVSRQLGKSTCSMAYILWLAIFNSTQTILILSNVQEGAIEILDRIKYSYELLPNWLKPGVEYYNKKSVGFDNKSRILARATTKNSARGLSLSLVYCDEFAVIDPKIQREFFAAVWPTLSSSKGKCIITSTPSSDEDTFAKIWFDATNTFDEYGNELPNGVGRNQFKATKFIWSDHPGRNEAWEKAERAVLNDDTKFEREHACVFLTSEDTLIDAQCLAKLKGKDPEFVMGRVRWYSRPLPNKTYLVALDPSMGVGRDPAAIQVFQLPEMIQVAEWQHNKTGIEHQVKLLREILKYIQENQDINGSNRDGEIYWSLENNLDSANVIIREIGEDNFPGTYISDKKNGRTSIDRRGFNMTNSAKLKACAKLKSLIEKNRLHITSRPLVSQLKNFVSKGASFAAKGTEHDDLVMATIIIICLFERVMNYDDFIREEFSESVDDSDEERQTPLWGVFN